MPHLADIKEMLIADEGWRDKPYKCPAGKLTIGVGHNLEAKPLSPDAIEQILEDDIDDVIKVALDIFGNEFHKFKQGRQLAIINMIFQLGEAGFKKFKRTIGAMQGGRWELAASHALESLWAKQTPARAVRVTEMLRTGNNIYEVDRE